MIRLQVFIMNLIGFVLAGVLVVEGAEDMYGLLMYFIGASTALVSHKAFCWMEGKP